MVMAMARDAWILWMARLQADWRAYREEFDQQLERGPDAQVVDYFCHSLFEEWTEGGWRAR